MTHQLDYLHGITRRHFLRHCHVGLGGIALATLLDERTIGGPSAPANPLASRTPLLLAKAKHVIFLHMAGGPSHLELFDYKPELVKRNGQACPDEFLKGQRFAFIKGVPKLLGTMYSFAQYGQNGAWFSSLLPQLSRIADDLTIVRSMTTEQFNHAPAQLLMHTGSQISGSGGAGGGGGPDGLRPAHHGVNGLMVLVTGGQ
jgi:hypothetical protein